MSRLGFRVVSVLAVAGLAGVVVAAQPAGANENNARHVLLISVDGLHQSDLAWYVQKHPRSALASLVHHGVSFTNASTPFPSDSFPGLVAQVTGGNPKSTGVYYDDSWNNILLPAGTTDCAKASHGVEVTYFEAADKNPDRLDAGQGLSGLPDSILQMSSNPTTLLDPSALPVDPKSCTTVYPHQYIQVNTVFEVARAARLRTAWSDKHPAYEILDGPSGKGVQDLFTPEINSIASAAGSDWTKDNGLTQIYDSCKVQAVLNEISGFDHSGKTYLGTPAIFGMNFQTVSTAQKLPSGGYVRDAQNSLVPGPLLEGALDYISSKVAAMQAAIKHRDLGDKTTIILSAKHGQSPIDPAKLTRIDDGAIVDALNGQWAKDYPKKVHPLVAFTINDDGWLMWLNDRSQAADDYAKAFLLAYNGTGNGINGKAKAFTSAGLSTVFAGAAAASKISVAFGDSRVPDVIGVAQVGTVYTGGKGKIAEHGGDNEADNHVPIVVSGGAVEGGKVVSTSVETTQIAPTILQLLGLDPNNLQAVQKEGTKVLAISS